MTIDEAKKVVATDDVDFTTGWGYFKYVQMVGGEYRFVAATVFGEGHLDLAKGEDVVSAGFVSVRPGEVKVHGYSSKLKLGPCAGDYDRIPELFC